MKREWTALFVLWCFFLLRGFIHIVLLPPLEGFDSIGHIDYLQYLKDHDNQRAITKMHFSTDMLRLLELLPSNRNLDVYHITHRIAPEGYKDYFSHNDDWLEQRKQAFRTLPAEMPDRTYLPEHFNWQGKHPPFYYRAVNGFVGWFDTTRFYERFFLARIGSLLMLSTSVVILFLTGRYLDQHLSDRHWDHTINRGYPLKIILPALFTAQPMIYIVAGRISNDALAFPVNALTLMLLIIWTVSADRNRHPFLFVPMIGAAIGWAVVVKTYALIYFVFLPLFGGFLAVRHRNYRLLLQTAGMLAVAAAIAYPTLSYHWRTVHSLDGSHIGAMQVEKETFAAFMHMYAGSLEGYKQMLRSIVIRIWIGNWSSLGNYLPVYILCGVFYLSAAWNMIHNRNSILSNKYQLNLLVFGLLLQVLLIAALINLGVKLYLRTPEPNNLVGYYSYAFFVTELLILWICFDGRFRRWWLAALALYLLADGSGLFAQMVYYLGVGKVGALKMVYPEAGFPALIYRNWRLSPWIPLPLSGFLAMVGVFYMGLPVYVWHLMKRFPATVR